jgi:hypothetical protein
MGTMEHRAYIAHDFLNTEDVQHKDVKWPYVTEPTLIDGYRYTPVYSNSIEAWVSEPRAVKSDVSSIELER